MALPDRPRWGFTHTELRTLILLAGLLLLGLAVKQVRRMTTESATVEIQFPGDSTAAAGLSPTNPGTVPRASGSLARSPSNDVTSARSAAPSPQEVDDATRMTSPVVNEGMDSSSSPGTRDLANLHGAAQLRESQIGRDTEQNGGELAAADRLDLNRADREQLEALPGIGPVLAGRILQWRHDHGRFTSTDDLLLVNGIGEKRLATLKAHVTVRP